MRTSWLVAASSLLAFVAGAQYEFPHQPTKGTTGWWVDSSGVINVYYGDDLKEHAGHVKAAGLDGMTLMSATSQAEHDENRKEAMKVVGHTASGKARDEKPNAALSYRGRHTVSVQYLDIDESRSKRHGCIERCFY